MKLDRPESEPSSSSRESYSWSIRLLVEKGVEPSDSARRPSVDGDDQPRSATPQPLVVTPALRPMRIQKGFLLSPGMGGSVDGWIQRFRLVRMSPITLMMARSLSPTIGGEPTIAGVLLYPPVCRPMSPLPLARPLRCPLDRCRPLVADGLSRKSACRRQINEVADWLVRRQSACDLRPCGRESPPSSAALIQLGELSGSLHAVENDAMMRSRTVFAICNRKKQACVLSPRVLSPFLRY